jgi:drug/metabolite transporter superfamily protein YnfA
MGQPIQLLTLVVAACFEVGGDALIRKGLLGKTAVLTGAGMLTLAIYGVIVNLSPLDFSKLLGVYVGVFAAVSLLFGVLVFGERIAPATWLGAGVVLLGSAIIQLTSSQ